MWFKTGMGKNVRYIAVHDICRNIGSNICKKLPAFHSITGCDSVSSFFGVGKKKALNSLKKNVDFLEHLNKFGDSPVLSLEDDCVVDCVRFVCTLYDTDSINTFNINELRYKLFAKKGLSGERLPPTLDSLVHHLKRANYQCFIWKSACTPLLSLPSPFTNGWIETDGKIEMNYMIDKPVPEAISALMRCNCRKGCKNNACRCRKAQLSCTNACNCEEECENKDVDYLVSSDEDE